MANLLSLAGKVKDNLFNKVDQNFGFNNGRWNPVAQVKSVYNATPQVKQQYRQQIDQMTPKFDFTNTGWTPYQTPQYNSVAYKALDIFSKLQPTAGSIVNETVNSTAGSPFGLAKFPSAGNTQEALGDFAQFAQGPLNYAGMRYAPAPIVKSGKGAAGMLKAGVQGFGKAAPWGAASGALSGLQSGQTMSLGDQIKEAAKQSAISGVVAGGTGGLLGVVSNLPKAGIEAIARRLRPNAKSEEITLMARNYIKDRTTGKFMKNRARWAGGVAPLDQAKLDKGLWPTKSVPKINAEIDEYIKNRIPQPGLTIKYVNKTGSKLSKGTAQPNQSPKGALEYNQGQAGQVPFVDESIPGSSTLKTSGSLRNDTTSILNGSQLKDKKLVARIKGNEKYPDDARQMLSGTYIPKSNAETIAVAKKAVRLDPATAEQRALNPQNAVDQAIGAELFNYHMDAGDIAKANEIINATSGTNEGQMIQILSEYDKTTPQGAIKFANNAVKSYNETHKNKPVVLSEGKIQALYDQAKKIQDMAQGRERNLASYKLITTVNDLIPSSIVDKALTVWKAGLLTSLRTHERNLIGNSLHFGAETAKDIPASIADKVMGLRTGKRSLTFNVQGVGSGLKKGLVASKDMITKGFDPEESITKFDQKHITWNDNPVEKFLKGATNSVFRTLGAEDKPFYHAAFSRSINDQAKVVAINVGKNGDKGFIKKLISEPTDDMIKLAGDEANMATFHNKNIFSDITTGIKNAARNPKYGKAAEVGKFATEMTMPFTGVPSSIAGQLVSYSPIGLAKGAAKVGYVIAKNVPELQRQAAQELGRGLLGAGLYGLGAYLMNKGLMTGQPKDQEEAELWRLQNKQANSVLIDGKWRQIGSIGPENLIILAGAKAQNELSKGEDASLGNYLASTGKDFMSQTFLQGVQQPLAALNDPTRYGSSYLGNLASSVIPNIVKDTAKSLDPYVRENNQFTDYLTNSLPGLRNQNTVRRGVLGDPVMQEPTGVGAFVDVFNSKTPNDSPIVAEISRLYDAGQSATPSKMGKNQTILGQKTKLSPEQLGDLNSATGQIIQQQLGVLMGSSTYQSMADEDKTKIIDKIVQNVRTQYKNTNALPGTDPKYAGSIVSGSEGQRRITSNTTSSPAPTQGSTSFSIGGTDIEGVVTGNKFNYIDPETGDYKSSSVESLAKQKISYDKGIADEEYALVSDQLKRLDNSEGWVKLTKDYVQSLEEYKGKLNQVKDRKSVLGLENKIADLKTKVFAYENYGGFKKPKSAKKIKLSLKRASFKLASLKGASFKPASFKLRQSSAPVLKLTKTYRMKRAKIVGTSKFKVAKIRNSLTG